MISNRIVEGILNEFKSDYELSELSESKSFEYLVNYLIVSRIHPEAFEEPNIIQELDVDKGSNFGIDSFCLIVNDNLVQKKEDLALLRKSKRLDVRFIFTQSKTSPRYDSGDILKFTRAVKNVFDEEPEMPISEETEQCRELIQEVYKYENVRYLTKDSPRCELYYATTAKPTTDKVILGLVKSEEKIIEDGVPDLKKVTLKLIDSEYLIDSYNEIENRFEVTINFKNSISFERIDDVSQGYIGYLSSDEFLKLICDKDGNVRRNLFYENVRDFQGIDNNVNAEINDTIRHEELHDKFVILNNGVTIVAKQFYGLGSNDYEIRDYYIVNGCQTSNVIYRNRDILRHKENFWVPVKIVHTNSSDLITSIIKATNRQTPVPDEAFVALEKFHKRLQDFYSKFSAKTDEKIYYERRAKEFLNSDDRIEKSRIVNLHSQIRSFVSVILGEAQTVYARHPFTILRDQEKRLFREEHSFHPYFLSAYLLYKFYKLQNAGVIDGKRYAIFRYYVAWVIRVIYTQKLSFDSRSSKSMEETCENLIKELDDETKCIEHFKNAIQVIDDVLREFRKNEEGYIKNSEVVRRRKFKDDIETYLRKSFKKESRNSSHRRRRRR